AELIAAKVDLIVTAGTPAALAVKKATTTVPLVMVAVGDPVGTGLVPSLARPGGNLTTEGNIRFHDWIGNSWAVLFSHPKDFTPVCTTELGYMAKIKSEFEKRGVRIIGLSVDPLDRHTGWAADIKETQGFAPNYPMIADVDYSVSKLYGM